MLSRLVETLYNAADKIHARRIRRFYGDKSLDVVIDVGAHKGEFIRLVVDQKTPLYVFEPQSSVHEVLQKAISQHNLQHLHKVAVSDRVGEIELYVNALSSTTSTLPPNEGALWMKIKKALLGGNLVERVEKVSVTTLDDTLQDALAAYGSGLLKIDVEGNEGAVLAGASRLLSSGQIKYVQIENANYNVYQDTRISPFDVLKKHGYVEEKRFLFPLLNFSDIVFVKA